MITRRSAALGLVGALGAANASGQTARTPTPGAAAPLGPPRFAKPALYSSALGGKGFVVMRNGVLLDEHYPNGGTIEAGVDIAQAGWALAALAAARLVRDRMLDLDEPAALTIGDLAATDPPFAGATVRELLGLIRSDPATAVGGKPTKSFTIDPDGYRLFSEIVARKLAISASGMDANAYFRDRVLSPLGLGPVTWPLDGGGRARLDQGPRCSARTLASLGELVRRRGVWRARTVVSVRTLDDCLEASAASNLRFGLGWWLAAGMAADRGTPARAVSDLWSAGSRLPADLAMAAGAGGQRLYVIPSLRLVVARVAAPVNDPANTGWSDTAFLRLILAEV